VIILEQDPSSERLSYQAGVGLGPKVDEFLAKYDDSGCQIGVRIPVGTIGWLGWPVALRVPYPRRLTSWGLLYRVLRANFDGLATSAVPSPPPSRKGDGSAEYRQGKRVTGLLYDQQRGTVDVQYVDVTSGEQGNITADLVIAADGVHSTVRKLLLPSKSKNYSGYVAWRGTVPARLLTKETATFFTERMYVWAMKRSYMVMLVCPYRLPLPH
jgi:2-polyprenyl-6-methoxyphenol hydroxylase-like FAD-dependent oxidoreductase